MLKKSFKYLIIAIVNLTILTGLLALWTDKLELIFNDLVRPREFLKIIGFSIASLVGMRILIYYFRKKNITNTISKIKIAALLTFLISSYLYIGYSSKVLKNSIINRQNRKNIAKKIKPANGLANGAKAENLTFQEYQEIAKMNWFPKLPKEASNIEFVYGYDGFLPDYSFTLTYYLPKEMEIETIDYKKGDFSKYQTFAIVDDKKRITYSEDKQ